MSDPTPTRLKPNPDALFTEIDDGTGVLLHLQTKFYYTLNTTGVFVWKSVAEGRAAADAEIAEQLASAFRVEPDVALRDVRVILAEMLGDGLLLADPIK